MAQPDDIPALFPDARPVSLPNQLRERLTFKANRDQGRHGWLRLTPAYSVHLVEELIHQCKAADRVLDPFCGTGTTALVCAQQGIRCDTTDINPFLVWFANAKCAVYERADIRQADNILRVAMLRAVANAGDVSTEAPAWIPPIRDVGKWWAPDTLSFLSEVFKHIHEGEASERTRDLLRVIFCRTAIDLAAVTFGHQSMSFKKAVPDVPALFHTPRVDQFVAVFSSVARQVLGAAERRVHADYGRAALGDARTLSAVLAHADYSAVITSPPYPNRMSYIRELRPYMYWLGYLRTGREAGELDWQAIGGTWGCATSNLLSWNPGVVHPIPFDGFEQTVERIAKRSRILGVYVAKYFHDTVDHVQSLKAVLAPGARVHYVIGNSKFYDIMLHTERIYAAILKDQGFGDVAIQPIRKRTSKKELFEYVISARA